MSLAKDISSKSLPAPATATSSQLNIIPLPDIIKGDADWREYKSIQLANGVKCVFVNDKESKTTACSVCVGVGASSDPRELSGLAHFTEHMCFLGSKAYPGENEFKKYLSSHGGRSNASTAMSQTVYKFDILSNHAEKAIDIFANFFISPLFTQSGTSREINAVDSENSKNMSNDGRRRLQILKALCNPKHHYSKFSTGNAQTLAMVSDDENKDNNDNDTNNDEFVREALLAFHRRHYTPDNLVVVIVGPQDIQTLQEWIVPKFESIVNRWDEEKDEKEMTKAELFVHLSSKDAPNDTFDTSTSSIPAIPHDSPFHSKYQNNAWPIVLTTYPLQSIRRMCMYFPLPSVREFNDQSPYHIICHLLGHEGPGSVFALLQNDELIEGIYCGPRLSEIDHSLCQINVSLTEKGEEQWEDVVTAIFDYCHLMYDTVKKAKEEREGGSGLGGAGEMEEKKNENDGSGEAIQQLLRTWDEVQKIRSLSFHQTSPGQAYSLAPYLAGSVRMNGTQRSMSKGSLLAENKNTLPLDNVLDFLKELTPHNCFIEHCSQSAWEKQKAKNAEESDGDESSSVFGFKKEKWYGVDYHLSSIDKSIVAKWDWKQELRKKNKSIHYPLENKYIPTDLSLCSDLPEEALKGPRIDKEIEPPNLVIHDKDFGRLWHRLDDRYCLPKASLTLLLRNSAAQHTWDAESATWSFDSDAGIQTGILMNVFSDSLAQTTYDAHLAGLNWSLARTASGVVLTCSGYSQHLTSFATNVLEQFFDEDAKFINEKHLRTNKDRKIRYFKSYLTSERADNYAAYYTNLLIHSQGLGVEDSLSLTKQVSLESIKDRHQRIISLGSTKVECLISGNVSKQDAENFFSRSRQIINKAKLACEHSIDLTHKNKNGFHKWIPGPHERVLKKGEDVHLHFQSANQEEQNGAVRMTFQSQTPGYKGLDVASTSTNDSLVQTAALRTICHMLREPLFDQLRTKQQLGYIVNSYYDIDFSSQSWTSDQTLDDETIFGTVPINSIIVNVLSRKVPPPVITQRIDEFLDSFRDKLSEMPEGEIRDHTDALSKKMQKPIQKLGSEVSLHFGKIRRYSPEVLDQRDSCDNQILLPWDSTKHLALAIQGLNRQDLLDAWDSVVAGKHRSRVVSHVYGSSFKMEPTITPIQGLGSNKDKIGRNIVHINSTNKIIEKRKMLVRYGNVRKQARSTHLSSFVKNIGGRNVAIAGVAAGTALLVCALNTTLGSRKESTKMISMKLVK